MSGEGAEQFHFHAILESGVPNRFVCSEEVTDVHWSTGRRGGRIGVVRW